MEVKFVEKSNETKSWEDEIFLVKEKAMEQLNKNKALPALGFVYSQDRLFILPLGQFEHQENAKQCLFKIANEKSALFSIIVGLTMAPNPIFPKEVDYILNIVSYIKGKVIWQKHTLFHSAGIYSVLKSEETIKSIQSEEASNQPIEQILENDQSI